MESRGVTASSGTDWLCFIESVSVITGRPAVPAGSALLGQQTGTCVFGESDFQKAPSTQSPTCNQIQRLIVENAPGRQPRRDRGTRRPVIWRLSTPFEVLHRTRTSEARLIIPFPRGCHTPPYNHAEEKG